MGLKITDRRNFAAGLLYTVFGGGTAIGALAYNLGTPRNMGAGFFPFAIATALAVIGLIIIAGSIHRNAPVTGLGRWNIGPILIVAAAVSIFGAILKTAGLLVAVPVLVIIATLASPQRTIKSSLGSALVLTPLAWLLFVVVLSLPIPVFPTFLSN